MNPKNIFSVLIGPFNTMTKGLQFTRVGKSYPCQRYNSCGRRINRLYVVTQTAEIENGVSALG